MTMSESGMTAEPIEPIDKGMAGVVAAETELSDVRGDLGELVYCGYNINDLAENACFEEVIHLLHHKHLPATDELAALKQDLASRREIPQGVIDLIRTMPAEAAPRHVLRTAVSARGCYDASPEAG